MTNKREACYALQNDEPTEMPRWYKVLMAALEVSVCAIGVGTVFIVMAFAALWWGTR